MRDVSGIVMRDLAAGGVWWLAVATLGFIGRPARCPRSKTRFTSSSGFYLPGSVLSLLLPVAVLGPAWALFSGLNVGMDGQPFLAPQSLFVLCFIGIGFYPNIILRA